MLNKFFNFLKGYVIIEISGANSERLINICLRRGIKIYALDRTENTLRARVYSRDFKRLRDIKRKAGVEKIRIIKKCGLRRFLYRYRKRAIFALCAVLCAVAVHESFNHIWAVEINGVKDADVTRIAALLEENGVYIGASRRGMAPIGEIKNNILAKYGDLSWLWIYMEGSKARVEVSERRIPPQIVDKESPCDIVSLSEGVIKRVTVKSGDACVSVGDAVSAGDKLVSGQVRAFKEGEEERYLYVHSLGEILAYTMHTAETIEPLYDEIRTPTGRHKRFVTLEIFGKKYELFREKQVDFDEYDTETKNYELHIPGAGYSGLSVNVEDNEEVSVGRREISAELAAARARDRLEEEIAKELTLLSEKTDERLEYEAAENDTIRVKCSMSFIENIGTESPLGG